MRAGAGAEQASPSMSSGSETTAGTGPVRQRDAEGASDLGGDALGVVDLDDRFRHAAEELSEVHFLKGVPAPCRARDLAGEQHERGGVLLCDMDAGTRVGGAGSARDEDDAGTSGQLAIRLRHHGGGALLAGNHGLDGRVPQGVEHAEIALSGNAEDPVDALDFETLYQRAGGGACHCRAVGVMRRYGTGSPTRGFGPSPAGLLYSLCPIYMQQVGSRHG